MKYNYKQIEKILKINFNNKKLLIRSLIHKSLDKNENNEKLEFLGDNRDCSRDSRFLSSVGYVHEINLIGKAKIIFFSNDTKKGSVLKFWNWKNSIRINRFFKKLK